MSCGNNKFKSSESSSKARLRTVGAIDENLNILDITKFNDLNEEWSKDAKKRFGIAEKLFKSENNKVIANTDVFNKIDNFKGLDAEIARDDEEEVSGFQDMSALGPLEEERMQTERGAIGFNKQQILRLLGPSMYNKPIAQVAVKELLQNSFDAIKTIQNLQGNGTGQIRITIDQPNRILKIRDNGIGMTPDIVKNAFLSIGGTNKEGLSAGERSGGLGLAKVQFLMGSESIKVETVRDGIKTTIEATNIQLYNDDFDIITQPTEDPNGTTVEVVIPKSYETMEGTERLIDFPGRWRGWKEYDILTKPLIGNVDIKVKHILDGNRISENVIPIGVNITEEVLPPLFSTITFDWGTADLYMSDEKSESNYPAHRILSSGIYQFDKTFQDKQRKSIPYNIVVNIKPSVISSSEQYPFNNQREGFKNTVEKDIQSLESFLGDYARGESEKEAVNVFSNIKPLPKLDPNAILTPEEREKIFSDVRKVIAENKKNETEKDREVRTDIWRNIIIRNNVITNETTGEEKEFKSSFKSNRELIPVGQVNTEFFNPQFPQFHNNTNVDYLQFPGAAEFFTDFSNTVLQMVRFAGDEFEGSYGKLATNSENKFFAGVSIDKTYGGVHIRKIIDAIFVNPLAFEAENSEEAVGIALYTTLHEINHTLHSGEGANFTTGEIIQVGKFFGTGKMGLYEGLFRSVYKKHFNIFKTLQNEYNKSSTRNLSKSFEGEDAKRYNERSLERNENDVQAREETRSRDLRDRENLEGDKLGEIILDRISKNEKTLGFQDENASTLFEQKKGSTESSFASPKTIAIIKDFIKRIGVNIQSLEGIVYNGVKLDANGAARIMQRLIQVVDGMEGRALPEEAMHFAVEIIQQKDPKLFKKLLKEINDYNLFKEVMVEYGSDPLYQTKDGKPDILKLKKEAIAKVLVETIIRQNEQSTEKPQLLAKTQTFWGWILDSLRRIFSTSGFDIAARDIINGKNIGTAEDISEGATDFLQRTGEDEQLRVFNELRNTKSVVTKAEDEEGGYLVNGVKVGRRVSDIVKGWYERRFTNNDLTKSEFAKSVDDLKAEKGTAGHADIEYAFSLYVDETTGLLRETYLNDDAYVSLLDPTNRSMYEMLRDNLRERLETFNAGDNAGTRFLAEAIIYDAKRDLAGTIDFMAITPAGKVSILDWKFMDLNIDTYDDIPWYKVNAWHLQMEQYKYMVSSVYGVPNENFEQTRMIPIKAFYSKGDRQTGEKPELTDIKIGAVNVQDIEEDYLIPLSLATEKTGDEKIDNLLLKLNDIYKKLSAQKVAVGDKVSKKEQLNALFSAIRQLQMKKNIKPLIYQSKILNKKITSIIDTYNNKFKGKNKEDFSDIEISEFSDALETGSEALTTYSGLDTELEYLFEGELEQEDKDLQDELRKSSSESRSLDSKLKAIDKEYIVSMIGGTEKGEKIIKGIGRMFGTTATLQLKALDTLYKKTGKAFSFASMDTKTEIDILTQLKKDYQEWASSKGLSIRNQFSIIKKGDTNELIDEFNKKFYSEMKERIADRDYKWIRDNVDNALYQDYLDNKLQEEYSRIDNKPRVGTEEQIDHEITIEKYKAKSLYDISTPESVGWLLYDDIKQFPKKDLWWSEEWKTLNDPANKPALAFYNYIREKNAYYTDIGYIHSKQSRVFLPWVRESFTEKLIFNGDTDLGERFLRNISIDEGDIGYGQIDPTTGRPVDTIPRYFATKIEGPVSQDLFKTMAMYNEYAIKFKYLSDIEAQARALIRLERNKKAIATSYFGKTEYKNGVLQYAPDNVENTNLVESMVKAIIYGQRYIENESFDQLLGSIGSKGEAINKKLGFKLMPEGMENRQLSANKLITTLNKYFQLTALGFNVLSSTSNLFGGKSQSIINAGKYFTKSDFFSTELWLMTNKMSGDHRALKLAALDYFMPFTHEYNRDAPRDLSLNKMDDQQLQDWLMVLMRESDKMVQVTNFFSYIKNSIVQDGQVLNTREYLRGTDEYVDFYAGTQQERQDRADKFEKDVEALNKEKGVLTVGKIVDGKFELPGLEQKSQSVVDTRRIVQGITADALGSMTEDNKRIMNMTVYGNSFMVFKNWIPRLVDVRIGALKYNSASDAYEWGRTRMVTKIILEDIGKALGRLTNSLKANDKGIEYLREMYEKKRYEYKLETNKDLEMTEAEFINLVRQNIKNQLADVMFYIALWGLTLTMKAAAPDDDENVQVKNAHKFMSKATDKFFDEISYFYNPTSLTGLVGSGIFPAMGMLESYTRAASHFGTEMYALSVGDEKVLKKNYVIKYVMKSFPLANQMASLMPLYAPNVAKDLGIIMQGQYNRK